MSAHTAAVHATATMVNLHMPVPKLSMRCPIYLLFYACGPLQAIRIQTAAGAEETAVLHVLEQLEEAAASAPPAGAVTCASSMSFADMRVCALHQRSPIYMYMFDSRGRLLNANKAASRGQLSGDTCNVTAYTTSQCLVSSGGTQERLQCMQPYTQWK